MEPLKSQSPQVTVVIPTYQRAHVLREAIDSVWAQTYQNIEIVVVDDGSTDGTREILAGYGEQVRYIYQENRGQSAARNAGIRAAQGDLIAFLDSDDVWLPEKLALQVPLFDRDPEVGLVYSDTAYMRANRSENQRSHFKAHPPLSGNILREMFVRGCPMHTSNVVVARRCFDVVGLFDETLHNFEDQDMWFRIARAFKVDYVDALLVLRRPDGWARTSKYAILCSRAVRRRVLEASPWLREACSRDELFKGYYRYVYGAALAHLATGEPELAREALAECLAFDPRWPKARLMWMGTYLPGPFLWAYSLLGGRALVSQFKASTSK